MQRRGRQVPYSIEFLLGIWSPSAHSVPGGSRPSPRSPSSTLGSASALGHGRLGSAKVFVPVIGGWWLTCSACSFVSPAFHPPRNCSPRIATSGVDEREDQRPVRAGVCAGLCANSRFSGFFSEPCAQVTKCKELVQGRARGAMETRTHGLLLAPCELAGEGRDEPLGDEKLALLGARAACDRCKLLVAAWGRV